MLNSLSPDLCCENYKGQRTYSITVMMGTTLKTLIQSVGDWNRCICDEGLSATLLTSLVRKPTASSPSTYYIVHVPDTHDLIMSSCVSDVTTSESLKWVVLCIQRKMEAQRSSFCI